MIIRQLLRRSKHLVRRFWPDQRQQNTQRLWEKRWSAQDVDPSWRIQTIPLELQEAVDQPWFLPHSTLLDIGCGSGECANWLAQQGFQVLGIDFAPSVIARARVAYPEQERLHFQVVDICQATPNGAFQTLFDRGCLHVIPRDQRTRYVQQVATVARPGARFLLLHRLIGDITQLPLSPAEQNDREQRTRRQIQNDFQPLFEITNVKSIVLPRRSGSHAKPDVPGLAVWLVRR